jgi:ribosomal protein S12 methylthiotransferase accessory factor
LIRYRSSFRTATVDETLDKAMRLAPTLGISRVTEITRLDRIGIPVYAAIRPDAMPGTVCITAGKGMTHAEARAGAFMEAIEVAWIEYNRARLPTRLATCRDVLDTRQRVESFLELCPLWGQTLDLDQPMLCATAHDIITGEPALVPAELVFHPLPESAGGIRYFGTGSNGLASGNSVDEATLHALGEVIERDAMSFHRARDETVRVRPETLPDDIRDLRARLDALGFELAVRFMPNSFGLPAIMAVTFDRQDPATTLRGDGCHLDREIALTRAVTETIQSRASLIHGGRDDLINVVKQFGPMTPERKQEVYETTLATLMRGEAIDFGSVPTFADRVREIPDALRLLVERLAEQGLRRVLRVVFTPADYPVQVVKVIVPGLECYVRDTRRVGPRLRRFIRHG